MARLTGVGLELNSTTDLVEVEDTNSGAIASSILRSGSYSAQGVMTSGTRRGFLIQFKDAANDGPFFIRVYFLYKTLPTAENHIIVCNFDDAVSSTGRLAYITLDNTGALRLYDEDGSIGSASSALSAGTWYRVEIQFNSTGGGATDIVRARIDGVEFAGASNRNLSLGIRSVKFGSNLNAEAQSTGEWYFDDIAINDGTGSSQTSYPGSGKIIHLKPNAAGDNNQLEGAASTNYQDVDEVTPDDATTHITTVSDATNEIDDYNIEAPDAIAPDDTITLVQVGVRFAGGGASSNDSFVVRIKASASGTVEESSNITPASTSYRTNAPLAPRNHPLTLYDLPGASTTAWTRADLVTTQIGIKKSADSTNGALISTLWLLVESVDDTEYALDFDGSNSYVALSNRVTTATDNFSIVTWIKPVLPHLTACVFYNGDDNGGWGLFVGDDNATTGSKLVALFGGVAWIDPNVTLTPNVWQHVAMVRRSGTLYFYVNGVETTSVTSTPNTPTNGRASIGTELDGSGNPTSSRSYQGVIDELKVFDRALDASEITSDYNSGAGTYGSSDANLVYGTHMDEGTGTTIDDYSTNNFTGTLSGTPKPAWVGGYLSAPAAPGGATRRYMRMLMGVGF